MERYSLITNDVETTSLWNHCLSDKTGEIVLKKGMPLLLEAYEKYNVKATFYFTGYIAEKFPEVVKMILPFGHEVACHGLVHDSNQAFDVLSFNEQIEHLKKAKNILESISNKEVISFRAPALRVNEFTPQTLFKTGFLTDSSIAPQRIDMFLSFGSLKKLKWLTAPRTPYFTNPNNLAKKGNGNIFEVPVSSFLLSYTGTMMRISPLLIKMVRSALNFEAKLTKRPVLFLTHPNEFINEEVEIINVNRRAKNYFAYLLGDKLRYHIKLKNLGEKALPLLYNQLEYLQKRNYEFITVEEYYRKRVKAEIESQMKS
ncbi:MAG: polysaccharide deacetylase family protein [Saprospiraceae bacterium]|nr:polysaccharide deacetylase family protein [Saprospiraceae bacterium]